MSRTLHEIDPLTDSRWEALTASDPHASVFHTREWLEALRATYGYEPIAFTAASPGDQLDHAAVFCRIRSWLTGSRLVSLPFSDHCEFLGAADARAGLQDGIERLAASGAYRYIETRQYRSPVPANGPPRFYLHSLDLTPSLDAILQGFHADSILRKLRRAEREGLTYAEGQDERLLHVFYNLLIQSRRRHLVPPQPVAWFRNLIRLFGGNLKIRVAYKNSHPIAAILTIRHKNTLVYKYGGSDERWHPAGGVPFLMWQAILDAKSLGLSALDLGRSDSGQTGLVRFKERLGGRPIPLTYRRFPERRHSAGTSVTERDPLRLRAALFRRLPNWALEWAGNVLYRHMG